MPELPYDSVTGKHVAVTGRVIYLRNIGKSCFAMLREGDGTEPQAIRNLAEMGVARLDNWKADVGLRDHVSALGEVGASRQGSRLYAPRNGGRRPRRYALFWWRARSGRGNAGASALRGPHRTGYGSPATRVRADAVRSLRVAPYSATSLRLRRLRLRRR